MKVMEFLITDPTKLLDAILISNATQQEAEEMMNLPVTGEETLANPPESLREKIAGELVEVIDAYVPIFGYPSNPTKFDWKTHSYNITTTDPEKRMRSLKTELLIRSTGGTWCTEDSENYYFTTMNKTQYQTLALEKNRVKDVLDRYVELFPKTANNIPILYKEIWVDGRGKKIMTPNHPDFLELNKGYWGFVYTIGFKPIPTQDILHLYKVFPKERLEGKKEL